MTSPIIDNNKAESQLRMNPRTASHRLNRNIVISLLAETNRDKCLRCSCLLNHDTWSVEHLEEWLDSPNPVESFFRLDNIGFVCKTCNSTYNRGRFDVRKGTTKLVKPIRYNQPALIPPGQVAVKQTWWDKIVVYFKGKFK